MNNPKLEALKTVLRPLVFAALMGAVDSLLAYFKVASYNPLVIYIGTTVLTYLDKYLHEHTKLTTGATGKAQGILPF